MASSLIDLIKELRGRTGAGLMDCKAALLACDSDIDKACDWLREKGISKAAKKASRIAAEGLALVQTCDRCGKSVILEVNCETDFVAKGEQFHTFVNDIAKVILQNNITDLDAAKEATKDLLADATVKMGEKFDLRRFAIISKNDDEVVNSYIHMGGKIACIVKIKGGSMELAEGLAMHITASNPQYDSYEKIPTSDLAHERDIQRELALKDEKFTSKPAQFQEQILDGKVKKHFAELVLESQEYVMDETKTVGQVLKENNCTILEYVRYGVGEGIEKRSEDFASEVMKELNK